MIVHRRTQLPRNRSSLVIHYPVRRDYLLRTCKISAVRQRIVRYNASVFLSGSLQTVIYQYVRLIAPYHFDKLCSLPFFLAHIPIRKVKPQKIQLSVIGHQLLYLTVHIFQIVVKIILIVFKRLVSAHRMMPVVIFRIIRMMPVKQGIIQTNF